MRLKIRLKPILLYCLYALLLIALNAVLPGVPLSLGLCFSMLICGTNLIVTPVLYIVCSVINLDWVCILLSIFESGFITLITFIYRRTKRKIRIEAAAYILIALAPFIAFSRWQGIDSLYFTANPYILKSIAALTVVVFTLFAFISVRTLIFRLYRCKIKSDELLCLAVLFSVSFTGVYNLSGHYAYVCIAAGICAAAVRLLKSPSAIIVAVVTAVPCILINLELTPVTAFILICIFSLIFAPLGRLAPSLSCIAGTAAYFYFCGCYSSGVVGAVLYTLLLCFLCLLSALPSNGAVQKMRDMLAVKKVLPRTEEDQLKEFVSEKLYKMSEVFREIEAAFVSLDEGPDDTAMKKRMLTEIKQSMCSGCKNAKNCQNTKVYKGFAALIEMGCIKGKVTFVDLTSDITLNCINPASLTETLNKLLYEYRKTNLEAENAKSGRKLLAGQARGIAEVLKNRAVEFCREQPDYSAVEKKAINELAANGISCPEIRMRGDKNREIYLTLVDCNNSYAVQSCLEKSTGLKLMLKDKIQYDNQKAAFIFTQPPRYDAAFGVAFAVKEGERVSGDTHSVIKINEHSFLMALSDGMGSGEYARKVSATAISLIEAFYRSEMPSEIVLDTINKLLCFNRDERFTCIDAAEIDLNTLKASFIKIGSPVGIIVRKGEIKVLESHSLPLGILDNLHPSTSIEQLKKDDIVVFMSDGVTSSFGGVTELYDFISTLKPLNPQSLAEKILAAAKNKVTGTPDDMTVLCVRLFERNLN